MLAPNCLVISRSSREWIAMWHPTSNSTVIDHIQKKYSTTNFIVGQHYIEWLDANTATLTSHSSSPVLIQCQGCHLNDSEILLSRNLRSSCLFISDANLIMILDQSNI